MSNTKIPSLQKIVCKHNSDNDVILIILMKSVHQFDLVYNVHKVMQNFMNMRYWVYWWQHNTWSLMVSSMVQL